MDVFNEKCFFPFKLNMNTEKWNDISNIIINEVTLGSNYE